MAVVIYALVKEISVEDFNSPLLGIALPLYSLILLFFLLKSPSIVVDDEKEAIIVVGQEKYPYMISTLRRIDYKENRKGKHRGIMIRGEGVRFVHVILSKEMSDAAINQILCIRPDLPVSHVRS